jgi:hypothetical protein
MFPFLTSYDPPGTSEGTLDPLGLYQIADQLAMQLVPAVRERMQRIRFLPGTRAYDSPRRGRVGHAAPGLAVAETTRATILPYRPPKLRVERPGRSAHVLPISGDRLPWDGGCPTFQSRAEVFSRFGRKPLAKISLARCASSSHVLAFRDSPRSEGQVVQKWGGGEGDLPPRPEILLYRSCL